MTTMKKKHETPADLEGEIRQLDDEIRALQALPTDRDELLGMLRADLQRRAGAVQALIGEALVGLARNVQLRANEHAIGPAVDGQLHRAIQGNLITLADLKAWTLATVGADLLLDRVRAAAEAVEWPATMPAAERELRLAALVSKRDELRRRLEAIE